MKHACFNEQKLYKAEVNKELESMGPEEIASKAKEIASSRILTQEEFKQIRLRQMSKEVDLDKKKREARGKKRPAPSQDDENVEKLVLGCLKSMKVLILG